MLDTKFRGNRSTASEEEDFEGFYHIWAWAPSWSCDQDAANKLSLCPNFEKVGGVYCFWSRACEGHTFLYLF